MNFCCDDIKYLLEYFIKSITAVSSNRIVSIAYAITIAKNIGDLLCAKISIEINKEIHIIEKSFNFQNHKFALDFKFCGYIYVVILSPYLSAVATLFVKLTADDVVCITLV